MPLWEYSNAVLESRWDHLNQFENSFYQHRKNFLQTLVFVNLFTSAGNCSRSQLEEYLLLSPESYSVVIIGIQISVLLFEDVVSKLGLHSGSQDLDEIGQV